MRKYTFPHVNFLICREKKLCTWGKLDIKWNSVLKQNCVIIKKYKMNSRLIVIENLI